jgi:hypothetical protein
LGLVSGATVIEGACGSPIEFRPGDNEPVVFEPVDCSQNGLRQLRDLLVEGLALSWRYKELCNQTFFFKQELGRFKTIIAPQLNKPLIDLLIHRHPRKGSLNGALADGLQPTVSVEEPESHPTNDSVDKKLRVAARSLKEKRPRGHIKQDGGENTKECSVGPDHKLDLPRLDQM